VPLLVKVIDKPLFELGEPFIIPCDATGITLQVIPDDESNYNWSNGSNASAIIAPSRGNYWLYAENMCGNHSDSVVAVECKDKCVQLPTAFTPNRDGKNDNYSAACFCPVPKFKLVIFNRNGEIVFQTTNPQAGWNGNFKGQQQPNGVYIYYTEFFDFVLKQSFTEKGTLVLLR
jgi:gliding motility-associated-like protein